MAAPPKAMNNIHDKYPDNDKMKHVFIQADNKAYPGYGDRHVLLWWSNSNDEDNDSNFVTQVIQLTGQAGNYNYYAPVVKPRSPTSTARHLQIDLGNFTREERDKILDLAKRVQFNKKSTVNGCRVWTRDLLESMVNQGLITKAKFESIDAEIPLMKRKEEA
ncbi:hypothetical protein AGABI1DRAFT_130120 [Agaricus bisporus var. burnettii JB137-S8]|uniref:DUF7770 domain-containing protein n=2 Tax=Agaricus bisporus var. burnettii TaxID=192524 RepID=K5X4I1_AGABU|nr:uncharacterized protein AGABI1DRAFT_130120 [Agaricus bisporus var. burnettii JB137-S8]EKM77847.1 hypothetical protein AGABI1DRAFT_130120 [Agaricus bisporus var. burnettii JB137-S8]KAF7763832.1 hypothetical protein Agabi119p4_8369 [Agaricus bisporus var. burnettii]